ncbi:hypothetical protein JCM9279_005875 [Rhodotorula babjevae]
MSAEWDQTCLVCVINTENRCSSCAKAGIDLFFCSPDHQKLVWKAHRRVCGPGKANPFMWPLLSQLEADETIEHMHETTGLFLQVGHVAKSVAGCMHSCNGYDAEELPGLVRGLVVDTPQPAGPTATARQRFLGDIRAFEVMRQSALPADARTPLLATCRDPMAALAFDEFVTASPRDLLNPEPWRAKYRHIMLVRFSLVDLWRRTAGQEPPAEWLDRIFERTNDFVRAEVQPLQPRVAEKLFVEERSSETVTTRPDMRGPAA